MFGMQVKAHIGIIFSKGPMIQKKKKITTWCFMFCFTIAQTIKSQTQIGATVIIPTSLSPKPSWMTC